MEKIIPKYQAYLSQKGYAWYSVNRHHNYTVKEYIQFIRTQGINDFKETTAVQILAYKSYLEGRENKVVGGKLQGKTIYDQLRGLDLLYEYLQIIGRVSHNPVSEIEVKAPPNNQRRITVTESQIKQLYRACKDSKERAVLSLNYGCGLRVGELEKLELGDLKIDDGYLIVRKGKGNKRRSVPMSIGVIKDMINYLKTGRPRLTTERHYHRNNQSVMLNEIGRPMREWSFNRTLQMIAKRTENRDLISKRISTHIMRHSIATHLLNRGLDINQVRHFLGHVLLSTTQIYTHIDHKQVLQL